MRDLLLVLATVALSLGLLPAIVGPHKPAFATCVVSTIACGVIGGVDLSARFRLAAVVMALCTAGWLILSVQTR